MNVPVIGESVTEVTLSQWLKEDGAYVELDEPICEFESDKATLEFPAEAAGKLIYVASEGDDLEIGALVAKIDTSVTADAGSGGGGSTPKKEKAEETSSAPAPATSQPKSQPEPDLKKAPEKAPDAEPAVATYAAGTPSPAAGKLLRENDIPAKSVTGTGRDGRITKADAQQAVADKESAPAAPQAPAKETKPAAAPQATGTFSREVRREKMSRMRRTIADRLVSAKNETAMLTTFNEVDLTAVMALRKQVQDRFVEKFGVKLGFMSLFAKACAKVLMDMPAVNAMIDDKELIYHDYADISFAISTPTGLVVPPIHNVESLHFAEIELKLKELAEKARNGKLSIEEMQGGTFTITNGGVFGSLLSTPIINKPQSAILGMHGIKNRPVAIDGKVEIRPMMYLALSYDHRVIDGSSSVTFLVKLIELLEDPNLLFLDL